MSLKSASHNTSRLTASVFLLYIGAICSAPRCLAAFDYAAARDSIFSAEQQIRDNRKHTDESQRLRSFIDLFFRYSLLEYPEFGTSIGHPEGNDRWTDMSLEAIARRKRDVHRFRALIKTIARDRLNADEQLNYDLLVREFDESIRGQNFAGEYLAISQLNGVHQSVVDTIAMMPTRTVKQYEDILARLKDTPTRVENTIALLKEGVKSGITPPGITLREVPNQIQNLLMQEPLKSPLLKPFANFPKGIPKDSKQHLVNKATTIYRDRLFPAFERLHHYLENRYIPRTRRSIAMLDLPKGRAWYAYRVRKLTTTDMTPTAIHKLGLREVKRIRKKMEKVISDSGFKGSFAEFNRYLRSDPRFYFNNADDLLNEYRAIAKRADARLGKLFGKLPKLRFEVLPVPAFAEKSKPAAYYQQGSLETGRPGYFFANTYDLKSRPKWGLVALTLHEAVPGHHLQVSLQQELVGIPWFRRYGGYTAFMEGWGLYAESLGYSLGFYQDPYSQFGQLDYEIWRALRLVVDTGIHALNWSRRKAIDYFEENTGKSRNDIEVEVDRYIVWPAQALAYKIGELRIIQLRKKAEKILWKRFDIRAFHDAVLGGGAMPLDILENQVNTWIVSQSNPNEAQGGGWSPAIKKSGRFPKWLAPSNDDDTANR